MRGLEPFSLLYMECGENSLLEPLTPIKIKYSQLYTGQILLNGWDTKCVGIIIVLVDVQTAI